MVHHCPPYSVLIQVLTTDIILRYLVGVDFLSLIVFRIFNTREHIGFKGVPFFDQLKEAFGIKMFDFRECLQVARQFSPERFFVLGTENAAASWCPRVRVDCGLFLMPAISFLVRAFSLSPFASFLEACVLELTVFSTFLSRLRRDLIICLPPQLLAIHLI